MSCNYRKPPLALHPNLPPTYDKLDRGKLKKDIERYGSAGVPQEKMSFWKEIDSIFSSLDSEAAVRSEIHPLDALLAKGKIISEEAVVPHVSSKVVGTVEKDRAPIPEVKHHALITLSKLAAVHCVK